MNEDPAPHTEDSQLTGGGRWRPPPSAPPDETHTPSGVAKHSSWPVVPGADLFAAAVPSAVTLSYAARIALALDVPIQLDYYRDTKDGCAYIEEDTDAGPTRQRYLTRSAEESTSAIQRMFKVPDGDYLVVTMNSLYVVAGAVRKRNTRSPQR